MDSVAIVVVYTLQMLDEDNFRYSGARICSYLSQNLQLSCGSFERLVLKRFTINAQLAIFMFYILQYNLIFSAAITTTFGYQNL